MNQNPLFIEYYPHTQSDCFKINIPWTRWKAHTVVLCEASEGIAEARRLAKREIIKHLTDALNRPLQTEGGQDGR